ncbi:ABC transporter substrate-binding protein [Georhizobium profundi]|jgi:branched-chain amino acid transport system substrate-binding protein|uniref:ABC transporter substrate-binding protein n=1 Tax=Georhizobium profundi TaxID=2341112 RepID=A0A3Q8XLK4_9HYPH|nr:ABC transporter substrate-binding protein [Georhizobium profundi]AZN70355.1 ABC transporter substrate-binding protein [Georhizobium profundi]
MSHARRLGGGRTIAALFTTALLASTTSFAQEAVQNREDGVFADRIVFGQAAPLDGPASALGLGMQLGIQAAFQEVNAAGGVHGRQLELISRDDHYEPARSIDEVRRLIGQDKVFGLIGPVGTPTSAATQPIAMETNVPFIGAFTGAGFLRDPKLANVVNIRASYDAETETWMKLLVDERKLKRIAILYQDDAFGRAGLSGAVAALERREMELVARGTYQRNTTAVKAALLELRKANAQAVVMVGAYLPIAEFVKVARSIDFDPTFVNISFVGSDALASALDGEGEGVIVSQVVPFPWDETNPLIAAYQAALANVDGEAKPSFVSLEGYITGRLAAMAIEEAGPEPTREAFLNGIRKRGSFEMDGLTLQFGPEDNQGLDDVFLTEIGPDGAFRPLAGPQS